MKPKRPSFFSKAFHFLKNQKGFSNIELAIGSLIIISLICAITDFSKTSAADSSVSAVINYVAETVSEQGGFNNTKPAGYKKSYTTTNRLLDNVRISMRAIGVSDSNWKLYIKGPGESTFREITSSTNTGTYAYKSSVSVQLRYQMDLSLLNQNLPVSIPLLNREVTRHTVTTYYDRTDSTPDFQ